jgi:hypothetical protein
MDASPLFLFALEAAARIAVALSAYVGFFVALWGLYVICAGIDRQKHAPAILGADGAVLVPAGLSPLVARIDQPLLYFALLCDVVGNVLLSLAMLELPREFVITQRITRHIERGSSPWRRAFSLAIRVNLDGFDRRGVHRA